MLYFVRKMIRRLPGIVIKAVPLPEPQVIEGFGSRSRAGKLCHQAGYRSILLVTDVTLRALKFHEEVIRSLEEEGVACTLFSEIRTEPTWELIEQGREAAQQCHAEAIVALGGGSVMDISKIIAASARDTRHSLRRYLGKFVPVHPLPLITVPSTAGTGAEMTVGAVISNPRGQKKCSVVVGLKVPYVILDSGLTLNAPRSIIAACGIDALSHGLEGCLADVRVSKEDEWKSRECVRLVLENLPALLGKENTAEHHQSMYLAAHYGGNAINRQLAGYVHALAHSLGGFYHVAHGEMIARCLLPVVAGMQELCRSKLTALARHCGCTAADRSDEEAVRTLLQRLSELIALCGYDGPFEMLKKEDYPALIRAVNADSINYSPPKTLTDQEIVTVLDQIRGE